jgi:hypothetical protein
MYCSSSAAIRLIVKALKAFRRSVQEVGFLRKGTLFLDVHVFDDDYGDYADTDYLSTSDVARLKRCFAALA